MITNNKRVERKRVCIKCVQFTKTIKLTKNLRVECEKCEHVMTLATRRIFTPRIPYHTLAVNLFAVNFKCSVPLFAVPLMPEILPLSFALEQCGTRRLKPACISISNEHILRFHFFSRALHRIAPVV